MYFLSSSAFPVIISSFPIFISFWNFLLRSLHSFLSISITVIFESGFRYGRSIFVIGPSPAPSSTMCSAIVKSIDSAIVFATLLLLGSMDAILIGCLKNCIRCDI